MTEEKHRVITTHKLKPGSKNQEQCPSCKSGNVTEHTVLDSFVHGSKYSAAYKPVTLSATIIALECNDCEFTWCDRRAEDAREQAVRNHLAEK